MLSHIAEHGREHCADIEGSWTKEQFKEHLNIIVTQGYMDVCLSRFPKLFGHEFNNLKL